MGYRAPLEGLQHRLAELEEELAGLRTATPATVAEQRKSRRRSKASKTVHALERRLAALDGSLVEAGCRELTRREASHFERSTRFGVALVALGPLAAGVHLVARSRLEMTWAESTCTLLAAGSAVLGVLVMVFARMEAENRRRGVIEKDDFSSSSD